MKYLTLIRAIALLHQHQRDSKSIEHRGRRLVYIEATADDIALANAIAHEVLGRGLDELPPQTRRLLGLIHALVQDLAQRQGIAAREVRFTRRDVRAATHWSDAQLKIHCLRLTELEYLLIHGGGRGHFLHYELLYDGGDEGKHLSGLIDPADLAERSTSLGYDPRKSGVDPGKSGPSEAQASPKSGLARSRPSQAGSGETADELGLAPQPPINGRVPSHAAAVVAAG